MTDNSRQKTIRVKDTWASSAFAKPGKRAKIKSGDLEALLVYMAKLTPRAGLTQKENVINYINVFSSAGNRGLLQSAVKLMYQKLVFESSHELDGGRLLGKTRRTTMVPARTYEPEKIRLKLKARARKLKKLAITAKIFKETDDALLIENNFFFNTIGPRP